MDHQLTFQEPHQFPITIVSPMCASIWLHMCHS
jgi:hypothetical protein